MPNSSAPDPTPRLDAVVVVPGLHRHSGATARDEAGAGAPLPPPWRVDVDVLNGSGDINFTRQVASRIGAIVIVSRARRASSSEISSIAPVTCEPALFTTPNGRS